MRSFLTLITLLLTTGLLGPVVIIAHLLGVKEGPDSIIQRCMHFWARTACWAAGAKIKVIGSERLSGEHGAIYAANHVSWFDIFALASILPRYSFVAKAELRSIPMFGRAAAASGIIFLERENRKSAFESYKVAAAEVQRGRSVVVCPEGTRGYDYHLRPFKKGPFVLAIAAQAPIIPCIIHGSREVMKKGSFWIRAGTIEIHMLEPIETAGYDYDHRHELMAQVWQRMADAMRELYGIGTSEHPIARMGERSA